MYFNIYDSIYVHVYCRFQPNLILGSTYSGQIVLWDNRAQKKTPIQRTPLSNTAHTVSFDLYNFNYVLFQFFYFVCILFILAPCILCSSCWNTKCT